MSCILLHTEASFLAIVTRRFHIRKSFPFLVIVTWQFHIWTNFFGMFVQIVIKSCFSGSFVQKTTLKSDGSCNDTSDSQLLIKIFEKQSFFSANTQEKHFVSKNYCFARHDDKRCFLPNRRYHIILIVYIKELLQKLDVFCFNHQHLDYQ